MLSIVFPVYSKPNFIEVIKTHVDYLRNKGIAFEIIVVADCLSKESISKLRHAVPDAIIDACDTRRGKGKAIRDGFAKASGEYIGFLDCDESVLPSDVPRVISGLDGNDVSIAVRDFNSKRTYHRSFLSSAFNRYVNLVLGINISDTQCGLKFFRKEALDGVFPYLKIDGFAFDAEILYKLKQRKVILIPILWSEQPSTTLSPSAIANMAVDVIRIRFF